MIHPHRTMGIFRAALPAALLALAPVHAAAQPGDARPAAARIDSLAMAPILRGEAAGMVIVALRGGDTVVARGYGRADLENDVPMTAEHVFQIASITKEFTAAAVLALVAEGRVELDAPVTRYLPGAPVQGRAVTVRQLLSHTAGIADYAESPRVPDIKRLDWPADSLVALVANTPFYFAPGEQLRYSNTGFTLAGQLIETLSGMPYAEFVERRILRPAGVAGARFCRLDRLVPRRARGYDLTDEGMVPAEYISPRVPFSAGGFCATAGDLAAWNAALHGGRVLPAAAYAEMVRPATLAGGRQGSYGLGMTLARIAGRRAYSHGGDIDGFTSYTAYFPDEALNVTVLINTQGPNRPDALVAQVADAILGPLPAPPRVPAPADLASLAGSYDGGEVAIEVAGTGPGAFLRMRRGPMPPVDLRYEGEGTWTDGRARFTFVPATADAPAAIWADLGVALVRWPRDP